MNPSGHQFEISNDRYRCVVTESGATLRALECDGTAVIDGFDESEMAPSGRGQVLAPWPNRLKDGAYSFDGVAHQAAIDEIDKRNAIHGLVRFAPWRATKIESDQITMAYTVLPSPAYPWRLALGLTYALTGQGLIVDVSAVNEDSQSLPFGIGFHPYLTCGGEVIDTALVSIPGRRVLDTDDRAIPTGSTPVMGTGMDFRAPAKVGKIRMDTCFTDIERDPAGIATVTMEEPSTGRSVSLWVDDGFSCLMIYSGDTLGDRERRRRSLAVEPMTCPPNALASGDDVIVLGPGRSWAARWGIRVES